MILDDEVQGEGEVPDVVDAVVEAGEAEPVVEGQAWRRPLAGDAAAPEGPAGLQEHAALSGVAEDWGGPERSHRPSQRPRRRRMSADERRLVILGALVALAPGAGTEREVVERAVGKLRQSGVRCSDDEVEAVLGARVGDVVAPLCDCGPGFDPPVGPDHARDCPRWRAL